MVDDEYLNGMARLCGWQGTIVYISLCRHANKEQTSFPSIKLMMNENAVSRNTILKGLKSLSERRVIEIKKTRSKSGKWLNNTYILLDKSEWVYGDSQVPHRDTVQVPLVTPPSPSQVLIQVPHRDTKETHIKETHIKIQEANASESKQIAQIFKIFEQVNPTINYGNKTNRKSVVSMIKRFSFARLVRIAEYAVEVQGKKYAPSITTPYQLETKLGALMVYYKRENNNKPIIAKI